MFEIQASWVRCELTIDEGYNRKSQIIFYQRFNLSTTIELEYLQSIDALKFVQEAGFEITNFIETYYGEVMTYYLSRQAYLRK